MTLSDNMDQKERKLLGWISYKMKMSLILRTLLPVEVRGVCFAQ